MQDAASVGGTKHFPNPAFSPPPLSPLCRTDLRPPIFAHSRRSRSLARGQSRGHPTLSDVRNSAIPVALDPNKRIPLWGSSGRFHLQCDSKSPRPRKEGALIATADLQSVFLPSLGLSEIKSIFSGRSLPIPFPHSLRKAIFGRIM